MKNIAYKYPRQRINGIWLIIVGIAMFSLTLKLKNGMPNTIPFGILYSVGIFWELNSKTRKRLSVGPGTKSQQFWANAAIIIMCIAIVFTIILARNTYPTTSINFMRTIWLGVLLSVGLHFFMFIPVHGKMMGIFGILTIINVLISMLLVVPLDLVFIIDGFLKLIFGILYIKLSPINF